MPKTDLLPLYKGAFLRPPAFHRSGRYFIFSATCTIFILKLCIKLLLDFILEIWYTIYTGKGEQRDWPQTSWEPNGSRWYRRIAPLCSRRKASNRTKVEPPRTSTAGGVWQSAFLTPRTVANGAIPEEPRPYRLKLLHRVVKRLAVS